MWYSLFLRHAQPTPLPVKVAVRTISTKILSLLTTTSHLQTKKQHLHTTPCILRVFRLPYRHSRRRLGSPWVRPINAALKYLNLAAVTPGATSTLSASSAFVSLCRFSAPFPLRNSLTYHAAIDLQPPSHTVLYRTPGGSRAAVLQSPVMPNTPRSSATQSAHYFSLPLGPRFPAFSSSPDMTLTVVSMLSYPVRWKKGVFVGDDAAVRRLAPGS